VFTERALVAANEEDVNKKADFGPTDTPSFSQPDTTSTSEDQPHVPEVTGLGVYGSAVKAGQGSVVSSPWSGAEVRIAEVQSEAVDDAVY
jgi:hypothetical protein